MSTSDCYIREIGYWIDKSKGIFKRKVFIANGLIGAVREKRENKGIFKSAYVYDSEDQNNANLYGDLYFDFDDEEFEKTRQDALSAISFLRVVFHIQDISKIKIYFSGNKGFHIIVDAGLLGVSPSKHLNLVYKNIATDLSTFTDNKTIDLRVYDNKRLFRLEGSIHESSNLYKTFITYDELKNYSEKDIKNLAKTYKEEPNIQINLNLKANKTFEFYKQKALEQVNKINNIKSNGTLKYEPPCIIKILQDGAISGQRNNTVAILSSYFNARGIDLKESIDKLIEWNEVNPLPLSKSEIIRTCKSIYSGNKYFGCSSIKSLNLCVDNECKFKK